MWRPVVNCSWDRRVGPLSWTTGCWSPGRTPEASCPGKGADAVIPGTVLALFSRLTFQVISPVQQKRTAYLIIILQHKSHVDCWGEVCLIIVCHCVVVLSDCVPDRVRDVLCALRVWRAWRVWRALQIPVFFITIDMTCSQCVCVCVCHGMLVSRGLCHSHHKSAAKVPRTEQIRAAISWQQRGCWLDPCSGP